MQTGSANLSHGFLGIPHRSMEEDELDGKRIPKGSMIVPNLWYLLLLFPVVLLTDLTGL